MFVHVAVIDDAELCDHFMALDVLLLLKLAQLDFLRELLDLDLELVDETSNVLLG